MTWLGTCVRPHLHVQRHARQPAHAAIRVNTNPVSTECRRETLATGGGGRHTRPARRRGWAATVLSQVRSHALRKAFAGNGIPAAAGVTAGGDGNGGDVPRAPCCSAAS